MRICLLSLILLFSLSKTKAQASYTDTAYKYIFVIKFNEIKSPGSAKIAKNNLTNLFDSQHQTFSIQDTSISIRSAVKTADSTLINKLNGYGYTVLSFSKNIIIQTENTVKKRE
ncbi:MAG: hypothetical protein IPH89_09510 [Bacteroidetes bacterium]|nr:hypothetical protein [Bacteroidota bacterium]